MIIMDDKTIELLRSCAVRSEDDLMKNEDFTIEEAKMGINGIRWFVQEWIPNHVNK